MHGQHNSRPWASLDSDYNAHQNLPQYRPPISRLPVELLSEIFLYACTFRRGYNDSIVIDYSPFDKRASPMNLSLTDSHWRQVAISIPIIWSNLNIYDQFPRHPSLLKLWLQRSGNAPLHIALTTIRYCRSIHKTDSCTCEVPCPLHEDPRTNEILSLLVEHSSRWEEINFNICMYRSTPLLSLDSSDLSGLKSPSFYDDEADANNVEPDSEEVHFANKHQDIFWKCAATSSLLEEVSICDSIPDHIHWNQLKSLSIDGPDLDLSILKECTQLEHLAFSEPYSAIDPIVMPNMKTLALSEPFGAGPGLDSFLFPSLESLSLWAPGPSAMFEDLLKFMQLSRPPLKTLVINSKCWWGEDFIPRNIWDPSALIELLSSDLVTKLTSLTMRGCPSPPHLIHFLSSPHSSSLPVLENLSIEYPAAISMTDITKMITLRNCGTLSVAPLRRFLAVLRDDDWVQFEPQNLHYESPESGEVQYEGCTISIRTLHDLLHSNMNVQCM